MKRALPNCPLGPAGILRPGFLTCLLLLSPLLAARGDQHWTTNGVHQGILTIAARADSPNALDDASVSGGRNYLGRFTLSYAVWSLVKEPVHDYIFTWDWHPGDLVVGSGPAGVITTRDLAKYPDLARQFSALKPISVTLATDIEFYDPKGERFGLGRMTAIPDLIEAAGHKEPLHVPGSPSWENFFNSESEYRDGRYYGSNLSNADRASRNQKLFAAAVRVQLVRPKLTAIEWPESPLKLIADEFTRREAAEKKRLADALAREKERAAKTNSPLAQAKKKPGSGLNPLESAAAGRAPLNPLERAAKADSQGTPANPLELASQGVRTAPENPLEKTVRLEAEERARQDGIRREQERLAEVARQEQERLANIERERAAAHQRELAQVEANLRREYEAKLAAATREPETASGTRGSGRVTFDFHLTEVYMAHVDCPRCGGKGWYSGAYYHDCDDCKKKGWIHAMSDNREYSGQNHVRCDCNEKH